MLFFFILYFIGIMLIEVDLFFFVIYRIIDIGFEDLIVIGYELLICF